MSCDCSCDKSNLKILIKYFSDIDKVEKIEQGDWIDLRSAESVTLKAGESTVLHLGVGMKLPDGYEAHIAPRSSTFKRFHILQTNGIGIIDNSYSGDEDEWMMGVYAVEDTHIPKNARVCQFRIVRKQPEFTLEEVSYLDDESRGGFGHTGIY